MTGGFKLTVPQFTVDAKGRLTAASTTDIVSITGTGGITVSSTGQVSANLGNGLAMDGSNIAVNLDANSGLSFNGGKLRLNIPTCTPNSSTTTTTDKSGRLVWTGSAFDCQRITDSSTGRYGDSANDINEVANDVTVTRDGTITIPIIDVNSSGEISFETKSITTTGGISYEGGSIALRGITDNNAMCTSAGQGLTWTGSKFDCTTPYSYSWSLSANAVAATTIGNGATVNFNAGSGLRVWRDGGDITYFLPDCTTTGYALKWNGSSYTCQRDNDTINDFMGDPASFCDIYWKDGTINFFNSQNYNSYAVGRFVYFDFRINSSVGYAGEFKPNQDGTATVAGTIHGGNKCIPRSSISHSACSGGNGVDVIVRAGAMIICDNGDIVLWDTDRRSDIRAEFFLMNKL